MPEIAPSELKARLEAGEPVSIVDIREEPEYVQWHILGARNLPVYDALRRNDAQSLIDGSEGLSREHSVVAVCRGGVVSQRAVQVLRRLGFEAFSLSGGMRSWGAVWSAAPIEVPAHDTASCFQLRRNGKGCLSYLVGASGEALVVDPSIAPSAYLALARENGLRITRVLETHVHADHLSRARELCAEIGAELRIPRTDRVQFPYIPLEADETLTVGGLTVQTIATPGHTTESCSFLVGGRMLLTGDTLFPAAVGRPDLEAGDAGAERGARMLHHSLHAGLLDRFGDLPFYPGHHGKPVGFDGRPIGGSLADARELPLLELDETEFVSRILTSLGAKPPNFHAIVAINEGKAALQDDPLDVEAGPNCCAAG